MNALLAWYFVAVWGAGYIATKIGLQYAAPFTFLTLRFAFGMVCLLPQTAPGWAHLAVAGLLMHAVQLGGSHYAQYLGMSAGVAALIISCQHKVDVREVTAGSLAGTLIALAGVTVATLYQKVFSPRADLKAATVVQFAVSLAVLAPLAVTVENFKVEFSMPLLMSIAFLVIFASILGVMALWWLLRHGEATRVTGMMYLPPVFAVVLELAFFGVVPSALMLAGIAVTCAGVAMTVWHGPWKSSTS